MMGGDGNYGRNGSYGRGERGQQHCCRESLRDYSLVKLKLQPSQTEFLFRSVDDCFWPCGRLDPATSRGNRQKKKKKELIIKEIKEEPYGKRKEGFYNNVITCA